MRRFWFAAAVLGFLAVAVGLGLLLSAGVAQQAAGPMELVGQIPDAKDRLSAERDLLQYQTDNQLKIWTLIIQTIGGVVVGVTAYVAWKNLQVAQANLAATRDKLDADREATQANLKALEQRLDIDRESQITNRFTQAIGLLGAELGNGAPNLEARLGAIYALERIARDSLRDHWAIVEVLSAYVRQNAAWAASSGPAAGTLPSSPKPRADIQAVLSVLGRRDIASEADMEVTVDLKETDLRGADLKAAHLERADLEGAHLEGVIAWDARFDGAQLREAHLEGADLMNASLVRAKLMHTHLEGAVLLYADFEHAHFDDTHLESANLGGANALTPEQLASATINLATRIDRDLLRRLGDPDDE